MVASKTRWVPEVVKNYGPSIEHSGKDSGHGNLIGVIDRNPELRQKQMGKKELSGFFSHPVGSLGKTWVAF